MRNPEVDSRRHRALGLGVLLAVLLGGCMELRGHPNIAEAPPPATAPCVDPAQIPLEPPMVGQKFNGDAKHDLQVLAPNAKALRDWGQQLRVLLEACEPAPVDSTATSETKTP